MVEIENDERRFLFAIELDAFSQVLFGLNKFDLDVQLARGLLNLGLEKQVVHKAKDARRGILAHGQRLGFRLRIVRRKARPMAAGTRAIVAAGQCRAVAVIHGCGVNAVALVIATGSALRIAAALGTASAPSPVSPSSTGGTSWSCIHIFLVLSYLVRPKGAPVLLACSHRDWGTLRRANARKVRKKPIAAGIS